MRIRTAIFTVYVVASAAGLAVVMALVLRDVRLRYVESMRRTLGDTAAYLAAFAAPVTPEEDWTTRLAVLPAQAGPLRVFACDRDGVVRFDSAGRDAGQVYRANMYGGGPRASENYTQPNVAMVNGELRVMARVLADGEHVGWVGVGRQLATIEAGVRAARWQLVVSIGTVAAVMVVLGWWIAARVTRSVERLTAHVRRLRDGRAGSPPASRAREIAELGAAFEEMREALEGRKHVERYTQTLAHEVKAPLAAIRGAAELLDENMPPEQRRKFLANIRTESARIQRIIERLLELSSLEARKALRQRERVPAAALADEAAAAVQGAYASRGVTLQVDAADIAVEGERVLLREALVNLLQNALDFSPAGGAVRLQAHRGPNGAEFAVEDEGPGVPAYALPRIFERFYSLPRPGTETKSTGLGLTLVREIAHLHGGEVTLKNRPAGGARATLALPAR